MQQEITALKFKEGEKGPHYGSFSELSPSERYCTCCGRELSGHAFRWLELDQRTNTYHDRGDVAPEKSQGWFPFGLTCAKKLTRSEKQYG